MQLWEKLWVANSVGPVMLKLDFALFPHWMKFVGQAVLDADGVAGVGRDARWLKGTRVLWRQV